MEFERDRRQGSLDGRRPQARGVVDALVMNERDLWVVVARQGESIDEWLHGSGGKEVAPLRVCRTLLENGEIVLDNADPDRDQLLSDLEGLF